MSSISCSGFLSIFYVLQIVDILVINAQVQSSNVVSAICLYDVTASQFLMTAKEFEHPETPVTL